ncbi:zinc-dependent metalloprotease [Candidatus Acetothermia bacterium]|nr:zinc-dependent metalloprotease [Candidatus Acetothermia bacterium]MBI3460535.1 zinc-dependent metalloprotease [Candidatus Acetothermia bacterium]
MPVRISRVFRLSLAVSLCALLFGLLVSLSGDLAFVTAQEAPKPEPPSVDQFVANMEASLGYFNTYKKPDGTLYLEVNKSQFNKDFLVVIQMARGIGESFLLTGYPLRTDMMAFRLRNDKIELVTRNPYFRGDKGTPLGRMVDLGFRESVRQTFTIASRDEKAGRYLIDATGLFLSDWPNLSDVLPQIYNVRFTLDRSRSTLVSVKGFPQNVEIETDLTFAASGPIPSVTIPDEKSLPIAYHYSLLALPDEPMKPRVADDRVGYFTTTYKDFSQQYGPTNTVRLVNRWRLEKKDPYAPLSEPVKPIAFYLENTIPKEFKPYIKEGIEAWNKAFEAAGIKNAIVVMDQPNDPNWDAGDARYSTIRWMPSVSSVFAIGPSDVDPRSGEILNADILFTSDWVRALAGEHDRLADEKAMDFPQEETKALELARLINPEHFERLCAYGAGMAEHMALLRYTLMADGIMGPNGKIPQEYVGAALREVTMHEVGHAFGLRHNFKASTAVPNEELQDANFTKEHGISASVMDYNPPNISSDRSKQGEYYSSTVGPYDEWAIKWGYLPVGNETLEPHAQLQNLAAEHYRDEYRYGTDEDAWLYPYALDPNINQWDLGSNPLAYYEDLQNLVSKLWTGLEGRLIQEGSEFWPLRGAVNSLLSEKMRGYSSYAKMIGGLQVTRAHQGDSMNLTPLKALPADEQRKALQFILKAFTSEAISDFPKDLLDKITPQRWIDWASNWHVGQRFTYPIHDIVTAYRVNLLEIAFWPERLMRIRDNAYRASEDKPFTLDELFLGFTDTIWADVLKGTTPADSFQRATQSAYLDKLIALATSKSSVGPASTSSVALIPEMNDARALAYAELMRITDAIGKALSSGSLNAMAKAHLMEAQHRIEHALKAD